MISNNFFIKNNYMGHLVGLFYKILLYLIKPKPQLFKILNCSSFSLTLKSYN